MKIPKSTLHIIRAMSLPIINMYQFRYILRINLRHFKKLRLLEIISGKFLFIYEPELSGIYYKSVNILKYFSKVGSLERYFRLLFYRQISWFAEIVAFKILYFLDVSKWSVRSELVHSIIWNFVWGIIYFYCVSSKSS